MDLKKKINDFVETLRNDKKKKTVFIILASLLGLCLLVLPFMSGGENPDLLSENNVPKFELDTTALDKKTAYDEMFSKQLDEEIDSTMGSDYGYESGTSVVSTSSSGYSSSGYQRTYVSEPVVSREYVKPLSKEVVEPVPQKTRKRVPGTSSGNMSRGSASVNSNMIYGVIANSDKIVKSGSYVKIRIAEEMVVDGLVLPKNSVVTGIAQYGNERMNITISSVRIGNVTKEVKWEVYEEDGNLGIAVPESILNDIMKDGADDAVDEGSKVGADTPFGSIDVNLKKKNQEVSFVLRNGHRIYLKAKS